MANPGDVAPGWWPVDAEGQIGDRLATGMTMIFMGIVPPTYKLHDDTDQYVVVTKADQLIFRRRDHDLTTYTWFPGYTGPRSETARKRLARHPDRILRDAVRRMLPKNKLARHMLDKLKIYSGPSHPHQAQQPKRLE